MPNRVPWDSDYSTGNEVLDRQHRNILAQCNSLADFVAADQHDDPQFHKLFNDLMTLAREHFATEATLLARCGAAVLDDHENECSEFEYLAADIVTTDNFEKVELQRFLALWWVGHIMGTVKAYRAFLKSPPTA